MNQRAKVAKLLAEIEILLEMARFTARGHALKGRQENLAELLQFRRMLCEMLEA